jgi:hypothetical protein
MPVGLHLVKFLNSLWILQGFSVVFTCFDGCLTELNWLLAGLLVGFIYIFLTFGVFDALLRGDSDFLTGFFASLRTKLFTFLLFYLPKAVCRPWLLLGVTDLLDLCWGVGIYFSNLLVLRK